MAFVRMVATPKGASAYEIELSIRSPGSPSLRETFEAQMRGSRIEALNVLGVSMDVTLRIDLGFNDVSIRAERLDDDVSYEFELRLDRPNP